MIPTTISELAKRHKWLTEELTRALALSGRDIDTMHAVDLVLDGLKKARRAKKTRGGDNKEGVGGGMMGGRND